jgi:hypothetical protein
VQLVGRAQVAEVNRVEHPAEHADRAHAGSAAQPQARGAAPAPAIAATAP